MASDEAGTSLPKTVTFSIINIDEVVPTITSGTSGIDLYENSGANQTVYLITANANDGGTIESYAIADVSGGTDTAFLSVEPLTGIVKLTIDPDYETQLSYSFVVTASDLAGTSVETTVTFSIINVDEIAPTITSGPSGTTLNENSGTNQPVYTITADSNDGGTITSYAIAGTDAAFLSVDAFGVVTLNSDPDYETKNSYSFTVTATDESDTSQATTVTFSISNVDEVVPTITSGVTGLNLVENTGVNQTVYTITAIANDGGTISGYAIGGPDSHLLSIDSSTGVVKLKADPDYETKNNYNFFVLAIDNDGISNPATTVTFSIIDADEIAPLLQNVNITSNNTLPVVAKVGDIITLSFTVNEAIHQPNVNFLSGGIAVTHTPIEYENTSGNSWTAKYTTSSLDTDGYITYTMSFSDLVGNMFSGTLPNSGTGVFFNGGTPTLSSIGMSSNNNNTALAKGLDIITVSFTSSEAINTPMVTFKSGGENVADGTITYDNSDGDDKRVWTAKYTTDSSDKDGSVTYSIAYSDLAGNQGIDVTGGGVTFDKTAPILDSHSIVSDNSTTTLAKVGDNVTLIFTSSEPINIPNVTIKCGGETVIGVQLSQVSGNTWKATYETLSSHSDGAIIYNISYSDFTGNLGTEVIGGGVTFDNTVPTLSSVGILSNNATQTLARGLDIITVSFTSSEAIDTPIVTFKSGGDSVSDGTITYGNSDGDAKRVWTAKYTADSSDKDGSVTYSIAYSDLAGNHGIEVTGSGVTFDKTAPLLESHSIASDNSTSTLAKTGDSITLIFTINEPIKTPIVTIKCGGETVSGVELSQAYGNTWGATYETLASHSDGAITYTIAYSDLAGNTGIVIEGSGVTFDNTVPTLSSVGLVSNNETHTLAKHLDIITLSFTSSEAIDTPVVTFRSGGDIVADGTITYDNSDGDAKRVWTAKYTADSSDKDGSVTYSIAYSDLAGNHGIDVAGSGVTFKIPAIVTSSTLSSSDVTSNAGGQNTTDPNNATVGDVVSLTFTTNEDLKFVNGVLPLVTFTTSPDSSSSDAPITNPVIYSQTSATTYVVSYTKHENDIDGDISFNIAFEDLAGNKSNYDMQSSTPTVRFDKTNVLLSSLSVSSNNNNTDYAKVGDLITFNIKTNHRIQTPELTFNGNVIPTINRTRISTGAAWNSVDEWTLTHEVSSSDPSGAMILSLDLFDLAGNKLTVTNNNITGLNVKIQHDAPTITPLGSVKVFGGIYYFQESPNNITSASDLQDWDEGVIGNDLIEGQLTPTATYHVGAYGSWKIIYVLINSSGLKTKIIKTKDLPGTNNYSMYIH